VSFLTVLASPGTQCLLSIGGISLLIPATQETQCVGRSDGISQKKGLLPTLIPLSGVGTACFHHVAIKIQHFIFTTGRLPDVNPP
jgi:hypothetical protein